MLTWDRMLPFTISSFQNTRCQIAKFKVSIKIDQDLSSIEWEREAEARMRFVGGNEKFCSTCNSKSKGESRSMVRERGSTPYLAIPVTNIRISYFGSVSSKTRTGTPNVIKIRLDRPCLDMFQSKPNHFSWFRSEPTETHVFPFFLGGVSIVVQKIFMLVKKHGSCLLLMVI